MTIDGHLAEGGWVVQSREEINRNVGLGVAVREFPTASGPVDYALFVGGTLCGVVEAKPEGTPSRASPTRPRAIWAARPSTSSGVKARSASNMSLPGPRSCFASMPTRRRGRAAFSSFTARRHCGAGSPSR